MVFGGGGTSAPSNQLFFDPPRCRVITAVGPPTRPPASAHPCTCRRKPPWSAVRDAAHSYGFASFTVDPGTRRGGWTTIDVTYYNVTGPYGQLEPFETFTLRRRRND